MQQNKSIDDIAKLLNGKASKKGLFVYRINSLKNASDGDISFYKDTMDRLHGKAEQHVDHTTKGEKISGFNFVKNDSDDKTD